MVASEPFPRAGVAVVGGECADGQGDGVAERSGMWGGTPNRPATGWAGTSGGRPRPMGDGADGGEPVGTGPPRRARPRRRHRRAARPRPGRRPHADLHGAAPWALAAAPGAGRSSGTAAGARAGGAPLGRPADVPDPGRPGPARARPVPDGRLPAQRPSTRLGSGGFRGVGPYASGGFRGVEPYGVRDVEPSALVGYRWPAVAPSASGGHRAVSADLQTWGGEPRRRPPCTAEPRASCIGRRAAVRPSIRSIRDRSSRAWTAAAPPSRTETTAVWSPGDYSMPPQQVTDTGRHHRRLAPAGW